SPARLAAAAAHSLAGDGARGSPSRTRMLVGLGGGPLKPIDPHHAEARPWLAKPEPWFSYSISRCARQACGSDLIERSAIAVKAGLFRGDVRPPLTDYVAVLRIDLDAIADAFGDFRGRQGRPRSQERLIHQFPTLRVIQDRPPHELDRLLGPVAGDLIFGVAVPAEGIQVGHLPHRGLRAIATPVGGFAF